MNARELALRACLGVARAGEGLERFGQDAGRFYASVRPRTSRMLFGSYLEKADRRGASTARPTGRDAGANASPAGASWSRLASVVVFCSALAFLAGGSLGFVSGMMAGPPLLKRMAAGESLRVPAMTIPEDRPEEAR